MCHDTRISASLGEWTAGSVEVGGGSLLSYANLHVWGDAGEVVMQAVGLKGITSEKVVD